MRLIALIIALLCFAIAVLVTTTTMGTNPVGWIAGGLFALAVAEVFRDYPSQVPRG
jgi:hypothetical protein